MSQSPPKSAITPKAARKVTGRPAKKAAATNPAEGVAEQLAAAQTVQPAAKKPTPPAPRTPRKTATAKKTTTPPAPRKPEQATAKKSASPRAPRKPATTTASPVVALATAPETVTLPVTPAAEPAQVRHSWFSRRPLAFSPPDWSAGWREHGRRLTRFRTVLVMVPLLVGLAVAASYGTHLMYADHEPAVAGEPDVTCWDGSAAPAAECSLPSGVAGLEWVFPSFDRQDSDCVDVLVAHPDYKRPTMWTCTSYVGGRPVDITYSELTSVPTGRAYHEELFEDGKLSAFPGPDGNVDRLVWRQPDPIDGMWLMAAMYVDFPYAVLIEATTLRDRDRTYRDIVRSRDPKHITTRYG